MSSALRPRVAVGADIFLREGPGLGDQGIVFQAALQCPRFDPTRPQPDPRCSDQDQQGPNAHRVVRLAAA